MGSRSAIGFHYTHVHVKSVDEAQADAPVLNAKPMLALSPLHEWKKTRGEGSYRLRDSLCNGSVKPFAVAGIIVF